jgi:hypothetical protein
MAEEKSIVWPYYRAHRIVQAIEILSAKPSENGGLIVETTAEPMSLDWRFIKQHDPYPGGFLVRDARGEYSFLKREKFLDLYVLVGVKEPVDVDSLRRDLEKAQEEADKWRSRYEDLRGALQNLIDMSPEVK